MNNDDIGFLALVNFIAGCVMLFLAYLIGNS